MAKLITEYVEHNDVEFLTESLEGKKTYRIQGPFLQSEVKNRNGRIYSRPLLEREVNNYNTDYIQNKNSVGELDHPPTPSINLDRVSHLIESLKMDGNNGMGVAKLLDTTCGRTAQALIEGGVKLGVSTRGVGSLKGNKVGDDFKLLTVDIVAHPSAQNAYVDGILESKEYIMEGNQIVEVAINNLEEGYSKIDKRESWEVLALINEFFKTIKGDL